MDVDAITRIEEVRRMQFQILDAIYFAREADASNYRNSGTWPGSSLRASLRQSRRNLFLHVIYPGRFSEP